MTVVGSGYFGHVSVEIFLLAMSVMLKVKEAEKKTEKDRALVKEGCGHIRSEDIMIETKTKTKTKTWSRRLRPYHQV